MLVRNDFLSDARVVREAETLSAAGYDVTVVALYYPYKNLARERYPGGFEVRRVAPTLIAKRRRRSAGRPNKPPQTPSNRHGVQATSDNAALRRILRTSQRVALRLQRPILMMRLVLEGLKVRPRVVHAHDYNTLAPAWLIAKLCGSRLVYDAHEISVDREGYKNLRWWVWSIERALIPKTDLMITTTELRARVFRRLYGRRDILVLQNRMRYRPISSTGALQRLFDLPQERPIVLYQGALQRGRGLRTLIRAAAEVPRATFVLIGSGQQRAELEALSVSLGLDHRVFFHEAVPLQDLPCYTASATIGVQMLRNTCLNHYTTDSNKLFEYITAGLAVVASNFPEIRRVVEDYNVGLTVQPDCPSALADVINRMLDQPIRLKVFRDNASNARRKLCWENVENDLLNAYIRLVAHEIARTGS